MEQDFDELIDLDLDLDLDFDFNLDGFNVDLDTDDNLDNSFCKPKVTKPKLVIYDNAKIMANEIDIKKNANIYCIVSGNFIFGDLLEAMIIHKKLKTKTLFISTLSLSENNVDSLANIMLSGLCNNLHLTVSSYFYSHERNNLIKYIYEELENKNWEFTLSVAGTHMKIALIETDEFKITIQGSANLRSSRNIEQFSITENAELFDFNKNYIDTVEELYTINQKSGERGGKLWHQVAEKLEAVEKLEKENRAQQK